MSDAHFILIAKRKTRLLLISVYSLKFNKKMSEKISNKASRWFTSFPLLVVLHNPRNVSQLDCIGI